MKKLLPVLLSLCLLTAACGRTAAPPGSSGPSEPVPDHPPERLPPYTRTEPEADWGIALTLADPTPTGGRLVCTQSGGAPTGALNTGSYYRLEEWVDGAWVPLSPQVETLCWTAEAWSIPAEGTASWEVDWSTLYGELPVGQYRIAKEVMDFRGTGDYDEAEFFAYFILM